MNKEAVIWVLRGGLEVGNILKRKTLSCNGGLQLGGPRLGFVHSSPGCMPVAQMLVAMVLAPVVFIL